MMSAKATFVFVCLLIHCSAYDYDNYPLCNMLVEENVGEKERERELFF